MGSRIQEIVDVKEDLALALASPTGDLEITAPIKGRSLISIKLPIPNNFKLKEKNYKYIHIKTPARKKTVLEFITDFIADSLLILSNLFWMASKFARKLLSKS